MKKNNPLDDELFDEEMLYVIDGELMNKTIKVLQITIKCLLMMNI